MKKILSVFFIPLFALMFSANVKAESLTLGWAAWDPANALVELSKEFTAETGIENILKRTQAVCLKAAQANDDHVDRNSLSTEMEAMFIEAQVISQLFNRVNGKG